MENENTNTKLLHKWTIENYGFTYYKKYLSPTFFQSDSFKVSNNEKTFQFFLRLYPNGLSDESVYGEHKNKHISLFLHLLEGSNVNIDYKFSIVDADGQKKQFPITDKNPTKETNGTLTKYKDLGFAKFISNNSAYLLSEGYLDESDLTVVCEIEILDQISSDLASTEEIQSGTISDAKIKVYADVCKFRIGPFSARLDAYLSHDFHLQNLDTLKFNFRLWPKGHPTKEESKDHVALYLYRGDCNDQRIHTAQSRVSIVDVQDKNRNKKWIHGKLIGSNGFGCDRYIDCKILSERAHELLPNDFLQINCEIELLYEDTNSDHKYNSKSNFTTRNEIKNANTIIKNSIVITDSNNANIGNVDIKS